MPPSPFSSAGSIACHHLLKPLPIPRMVGAHEAVPQIEIEAEVGAVGFVVLGVVGGGVDEEAERGAEEPGGKELVAAVAENIEGDLPEHEDREGQRVDRQREDDERSN